MKTHVLTISEHYNHTEKPIYHCIIHRDVVISAIKALWTVGETESIGLTVYIEISLPKKKNLINIFIQVTNQ